MENDRRYVIVGNGIAGTGCAETIRKADPNARITIVAAEPYPLYNRIALPPYLKRKVAEPKVFIRTLEWHEKMNIELLRETVALKVHPEEHAVELDGGRV